MHDGAEHDQAAADSAMCIDSRTDKTDESPAGDVEHITWRLDAFRAAIPEHGPIWPPRIRNIPETDMAGHCSLCGDELPISPAPRFPRCPWCIEALTLALNIVREGVPLTDLKGA
jgi:hypothetical protein